MKNLKPIFPQNGPAFGDGNKPSVSDITSFGIEASKDSASKEISQEPKPTVRDFNDSNPYFNILNMVVDPEVGVGIVDMGLIYHVEEHDGIVVVIMTLTSMGCPAGAQLTTDVDAVLRMQDGVKDVEIEVVWEPAWNPEMMNPEIRQMLFGGF